MKIKLNLLSEAKKNEVRKRKQYRLIVWQEILIVAMMIFYGSILAGIFYTLHFQLTNAESGTASDKQDQVFQEIDSAEKKFQDINRKVAEKKKFQKEHILWSHLFIALDGVIPEGILLEKMVTADRRVSLSGKASTRDILLQFQDKLNASGCFRNATLPLADLFKQENIDFQLDVDVTKECLKPGNV